MLDPEQGTLTRYFNEEDYPLRPKEIIPLRCIFSIKKSKKRWYMKNNLIYFDIQFSSRMCVGVQTEAMANVWLNAILKACLYANLKHDLVLKGEANHYQTD